MTREFLKMQNHPARLCRNQQNIREEAQSTDKGIVVLESVMIREIRGCLYGFI